RHISDGGAIGHSQTFGAFAEELHELADYFFFAQQLGDGEHQIGSGAALAQAPLEIHAHDVGREEIDRLAEHARLRLDATHSPAHDTDAVDHRGVRIGAHQRVGVVNAVS